MAKNEYAIALRKKKEIREFIFKQWICQCCLDAISIALNDPEVMGRDTFGHERLARLNAGFQKYFEMIYPALTQNEKASYIREDVDRRLRQIHGAELLEWGKRYEGWNERGI